MNFVIRFTTLLTLLALGACGGGGSSKDTVPPPGGGTPPPPPVVAAPVITTQPAGASADAGGTVTFTVVASGDGLSYQWKRNGTAIAGATGASYTTPALAAGDDQALYSVTVTNAGGSVTSGNATLTVTTTPPPPTGGGGDDGPLQPLDGPTQPFPQTPSPMAATPTIAGVSPDHLYLLSWDPSSNGMYTFGFLHFSGAGSRLYVPVGSFLDEVWLTTADVPDIGPAVTSVIAALDIEPADLVTEKTVTVNFTIPDSMMATIDPAQLIGFAADADGSNLHLVPIVVGNLGGAITRPSIKIDHLGIVGIAIATSEQQAALAAAWPTDPADQLETALAPTLTGQWRAAVTASVPAGKIAPTTPHVVFAASGDNPATTALRGYYNDVVVPAFAAADADPSVSIAAISAGYSFLRMAELSAQSGADGDFAVVAQQVAARINSLYERYADYVAARCQSEGGPSQLQDMLSAMRQLQLKGLAEKSDELGDIVSQCSRFRLTFRFEYTRDGHWHQDYLAGDHNGVDAFQENGRAVIEGETTTGLNNTAQDSQLQLTELEWTVKRTRDLGGVSTDHWVNENVPAQWHVNGLSVPVVRTRGGTPSSAITMYLSPFIDIGTDNGSTFHPFTATVMSHMLLPDGSEGTPIVSPFTQVSMELFVPALPSNGVRIYGPMLLPKSGSATSQRTRSTPYADGSIDETEKVTLTISRAQ